MKAGTSQNGTERFGPRRIGGEGAGADRVGRTHAGSERVEAERVGVEPVGADFGAATRRAALDEWRQRARAAERTGTLSRHPIATAVVVGAAFGLALAAWRSRQVAGRSPPRSAVRNGL